MASGGHSEAKSSDESFDFICTTCDGNNKIVEAVKYCVECQGYCCQSCMDIHKSFPTLKTHDLLDVIQGNNAGKQQARLPEFPTERCTIHQGKVIDMFCQTHGDVGCSTCIAKDHKSCPENGIYSIPDTIDTLFKISECKQTRNRLRDILVSISGLKASAFSKLEQLHKAQDAAIEEVHTLQKALELLIKRAVEASKEEIKTECKKLEDEFQKDKEIADNANALQESEKKLDKAEGNRAQTFVCSKLAEKKMKKVDLQQTEHVDTKVQLSFEARKSLLRYINAANGMNQILGRTMIKQDIYKVKGSKDINIRVHNDHRTCSSWGSCQIDDDHILIVDCNNRNIKRIIVQTMEIVDYCTLPADPNDLTCVNKQLVAIVCQKPNKLIFVSVGDKMWKEKQIWMSHFCAAVAFNDDKLYVTNTKATLYIYDMNGTLLNKILHDNNGNKLFKGSLGLGFNGSRTKLFVGNENGDIVCLNETLDYVYTVKYADINEVTYIYKANDCTGNIFVVDAGSSIIVQFDDDLKRIGVIVDQMNGLQTPMSMCCLQHDGKTTLFVTQKESDIMKVYELE